MSQSDYNDRSGLTKQSCDHSRGKFLRERDNLACYRDQEPAGGKARAIDDRGKLAEKEAGDCGSHKRVLMALRTADTCKKATGNKEECIRLTTDCLQGNSHTVCDGARQSSRQAGHIQETPRQSATVPRQFLRPAWHLQETPRKSATVPRLSGLLQETPTQSSTVLGPSGQLHETPRRCQKSPRPSRHLR
ncbi:hypothetical protein DPMN_094737 [Dreissena polymorpha]|uniref:Uncharacterized protein n=1 Tax=Dreissena polymorpha TaxID=45954 RepID=A0A9D4L860_DREPO|nr:hypothetical protein DPMN_094737 [Dreissena polymorpha]